MAQLDGVSSSPQTSDVKRLDAHENSFTQASSAQSPDSYPAHPTYDADLLDAFAGMDEDCLLGEPTIAKESMKQDATVEPPALPQKSSLRASRILDSLKLSSIESATQSLTTPHDAYMSSEEDASSSADEFSEYDYESGSETSKGSPVRRKSYEDTARVVSFIFSGKPFLVDLPSPRRSTTTPSTADSRSEIESPIETSSQSSVSASSHPPRTSSLMPSSSPSFLQQDPFAETQHVSDSARQNRSDAAQRLARAASTITTLNRVQRTFSLVRKRSRPFLRTNTSPSFSKEDITLRSLPLSTSHLPQMASVVHEQTPASASPVEAAQSPRSPVKYNDIIKLARKTAKTSPVTTSPPITSTCPVATTKRGLLSGLKHNRRSMKA